ncbi:MAG TPA: ABC transporter ATP-binding protein [Acidimicrobiales bacterium]|jgi:branched-chain amino acid transport system ATP-binding protein
MLEVAGLHVAYGSTIAVKELDLEVGPTEAVALLGPNGAGKSSTLAAISQVTASRGRVRFDDQDLSGVPAERVSRMGLIQVPEGRHVFPTLTVEENLRMGQVAAAGRTDGYGLDDVYELFPALVELRKRQGYVLSGGEQQMVAIGRALVAAPRLLMLDEPSLGLSPRVAKQVFQALNVIRERTPLLVVEQNTRLALATCGRGYVLSDGEAVMSGDGAKLEDRSALLASYLGQVDAVAAEDTALD